MSTTELAKNEPQGVTAKHTRDTTNYTPRFDIWETADELVLSGDLPGVKANGIDINFENDQLSIHGRVADRGEGRMPLHAEYGIGDFHRSFTIGQAIDTTKISAELSNGVLTVRLPKSEEVKPRRIEVKAV